MTEAKPATVTIFSKFDSLHFIGVRKHGTPAKTIKAKEKDGKEVETTIPGTPTVDLPDIVLMPGVNEVDAESWSLANDPKSLVTRHHIKKGTIEVLSSIDLPDDEEEAIAVVTATISETVLRKWFRTEKRSTVQAEVEDQLAKIKGEKKRVNPNPELDARSER